MSSTSQPELELEIMQAMRAEEQRRQLKRSGIAVKRDPAFVQSRKTIVIWIFEVVSFKNLREETSLSAISFVDRIYSSSAIIPKKQMELVVMCCLMLAIKWHEKAFTVSISDLNGFECVMPFLQVLSFFVRTLFCKIDFSENQYSSEDIKKMEKIVLNTLGWELGTLTHLNFLQMYLNTGVIFKDDKVDGDSPMGVKYRQLKNNVKTYCQRCTKLVAFDEVFMSMMPSEVAASIIATARKKLGITPIWPRALVQITECSFDRVEKCYKSMARSFARQMRDGEIAKIL